MPEVDMRCRRCGQGMRIVPTDVYNQLPPKFCPICGTQTLARSQNVMGVADTNCYLPGAAFAGIDPQLVQLLFQQWRVFDQKENKHVKLAHRFVDYIKQMLEDA